MLQYCCATSTISSVKIRVKAHGNVETLSTIFRPPSWFRAQSRDSRDLKVSCTEMGSMTTQDLSNTGSACCLGKGYNSSCICSLLISLEQARSSAGLRLCVLFHRKLRNDIHGGRVSVLNAGHSSFTTLLREKGS